MQQQATIARPACSSAEQILSFLSSRQYVHPHRQLGHVMRDLTGELGACPVAVERAVQWLELDPAAAVGRLRRTELTQLSRSIHRFWRAALA